jgi:hypothetical protein
VEGEMTGNGLGDINKAGTWRKQFGAIGRFFFLNGRHNVTNMAFL